MNYRALVAVFACVCLCWTTSAWAQETPPAAAEQPAVSFTKDIAPILVQQCLACHGKAEPMGDYQVHTFDAVMKGGRVTASKPADSSFYQRLIEADPELRMPKDADPLSPEQIALVERWIAAGATFDSPDPLADLATLIPKLPHPNPPEAYSATLPVTAVALSPDGTELAVGGYHEISIWNVADGAIKRRIMNVAQRTYGLTYNADGTLLAAASGNPGQLGEVRLFNPADGSLVRDLVTMTDVAFDVAFSPAGDKLAACGADRSIRIFDLATGAQSVLIEDHADWVLDIAWSPDGTQLVSASRDKTSKVFSTANGDALITYPGHADVVYGVVFSADGTRVLSAGADRKIHIWNPADAAKAGEIAGFGLDVYKVALQDGAIYACSADKTARQFNAADNQQVRAYSGHADFVYSISVNPAVKRLATGSYDGEIRIWNTEDGSQLLVFKAAPGLPVQ